MSSRTVSLAPSSPSTSSTDHHLLLLHFLHWLLDFHNPLLPFPKGAHHHLLVSLSLCVNSHLRSVSNPINNNIIIINQTTK